MAANSRNKFPADKSGTKYSEFKNTKRTSPGKTRTGQSGGAEQSQSTGKSA